MVQDLVHPQYVSASLVVELAGWRGFWGYGLALTMATPAGGPKLPFQ